MRTLNLAESFYSVDPTGIRDSAGAVNAAIAELVSYGSNGGTVVVPSGRFRINSPLTVRSNVTLTGALTAPPSYWDAPFPQVQGTVLEMDYGGDENEQPFVTLHPQATVRGLVMLDKRQVQPENPVSRPWFIRGGGSGIGDGIGLSIQDVLLLNPWQGIDLATYPSGRHYLRGIFGQPLHVGIWVDQATDVSRIADVHFWEFWSAKATEYTIRHGTALMFGRSDWQQVNGFFAWRYHRGIHFCGGQHGYGTHGQFSNLMFDQPDVAIDVERIAAAGVHISGLVVGSMPGLGSERIAVRLHSRGPIGGPVSIVNGTFWGPQAETSDQHNPVWGEAICLVDGAGLLRLTACDFRDWTEAALRVRNQGRLQVIGCAFEDQQSWPRLAVWAESTAYQTLVANNMVLGNGVKLDTPWGLSVNNL